ncbi:hypothetical protein GCM10022270_06680 [Terriglobus aquaticus]
MKDAANVRNCSVLFVGADQEKQATAFLAGARDAAVLITGESTRILHAGAMIAFERDGERLRFQVNPANAAKSGISFSSNLLNLASSIVRD